MSKATLLALLAGACSLITTSDQAVAFDQRLQEPTVIYAPQPRPEPGMQAAYAERSNMGGGFVEFLFGDHARGEPYPQPMYQPQPSYGPQHGWAPMQPSSLYPQEYPQEAVDPYQRPFDPRYEKQVVAYGGRERRGTIIIDTPNKFLFLVLGDGMALRYGIGVGRPGFTWSGVKTISAKREWPDWTPPAQMLARRPDLPRHMEGGPENPLGARAMYLGSSLYRIHGSNEPWTIGTNVSSGCIRMRNEDVIDLYGRVNVGTRVIVL
jgi:lipoprotein-anchoring transpeptidase ErfK/SrfK